MLKKQLNRTIRRIRNGIAVTAFVIAAGLASPTEAAGLLQPSDGSLPKLDLKDHQVEVVIEDGYAITTIEQRFLNPNQQDMEATYSFPVPRKAAVSEFTYWIDGKPVSGEVVEKEEARRIYAEEKAAGRETAVAEQDDYRTFDIKVWPLRAGKDVRIRLSYMQPAHLDTGVGRYLYPLQEGGVDEQRIAFWNTNDEVTGKFSFDLKLRPDYLVDAVRLPKHPGAQIAKTSDGGWAVHLDNAGFAYTDPKDKGGAESITVDSLAPNQPAAGGTEEGGTVAPSQPVRLDTDIVVYWREQPGQPGKLDLVTYKKDASGRGTFMLTLTPGMDLKPVTEGRDWTFVLDKSGSMEGKIATLAEGVSQALGKLRPNDRFRIFTFNDGTAELTGGFVPVTQSNVDTYVRGVRNLQAGGGTNLYAGLEAGLSGSDADRPSAIVLVTDGVANVGTTEKRAFMDLVGKKDIRLFTAIMGNSANTPLLEPLTRLSHGTAFSVSNSDDIVGVLKQATAKVTHQALNDMNLSLSAKSSGLRIADLQRDEFKALYRGEQLILFGHYWGEGDADIALTGRIGDQNVRYQTSFAFPANAELNPEIERLWAFSAIERELEKTDILGPDADRKQAVIDLSKEYGIVTPYTSMLVVRDEQFAKYNIDRTNQQRLEVEARQREARKAQNVRQRRVDLTIPMFQQSRPSHSGGGSGGGSGDFGLVGLLLTMLGTLFGWRAMRRGTL